MSTLDILNEDNLSSSSELSFGGLSLFIVIFHASSNYQKRAKPAIHVPRYFGMCPIFILNEIMH